ncbi:hypothetical protein HOLleu_09980 [Holothuria leucospilota]|uniref:Myb-like domain-containing protein n=1 Tax=Holothuria leucospilota TaxID=206669 RepID=A0A9Q1CD09_HOLLE|nr:hypothetical protein HOLleu_09980 [Holothuria leucospilota]
MMLMYEQSTMTESQLPPVYIKKESKRIKVEHLRVKVKSHKPEQPHVQAPSVMTPPQSLFNRPSTALLRMRRELAKQQQIRSMAGKPTVKPFVQRPTSVDVHVQDKPEWLINEDWALLQAVQTLQELPLALQPLIPGHTINWDLVSDIVNSCSRIYRSPKQCKIRYENVIIPREEGKILYDSNPKKQKKNKNIYRTKSNRPMKTGQLHAQDSNASHSGLFNSKFDGMKAAIAKRTPFCKQVLNNPLLKNPKHSAVLNEMNISYDKPMTPSQVAAKRAERIAKEKKQQQEQQQQRLQAAAVAAAAKAQQQQQQQQKQAQAAKAVVQPAGTGTTATVMQGTAIARGTIPTVVPAIRGTGGSSIVVNTSSTGTGGVTFATINKRMTQQLTPVVSAAAAGITGATVAGTLAQVVRSQGVRTTIPVTAIITTQAGRTTAAQVVSSVYTTSAQQPRAATAPSQTVTSTQLKNLGSVQIAFLRQQQQLKMEQRAKIQQQQAHAQAQAVQAQAQAQAQAAQQQVQLQALTKVVSPSVSTSGTTITQQQLSALQQQQLAQKLRSPEIQALLKQQALRAQKGLPTVKGLTVSSVSSVASQVLSQAQAQIKQQAVTVATQPGTLKTLTLPQGTTVSGATGAAGTTTQKVNFLQLVQMPKQHQKVGGGQQQQLSLSRVQQVTTPGQPATQNATLVQRVVTSQVRPQVQTVRQQLQNQVKRNQGTTLSIQQAGKPVTIIPHGASVLTASPKVSTTSGQQFTQLVAHPKQVLTQLVQQSGQTSTSPQLARIISQPAVTSLQQAKQQVQQSQQNVTQAIIIQEEAPNTTPNTIAATTQLASTSAAPSNLTVITQPQQKPPTTTVTAISVPSTPTVQVTKEQEAVEEVVEDVGEEQLSPKETPGTVRTSPYAMRLRKPSQSGGQ